MANVTAEQFLCRIELKCSRQPNYTHWCSNHMPENVKIAGITHILQANPRWTWSNSINLLDSPIWGSNSLGHDDNTYKPFSSKTSTVSLKPAQRPLCQQACTESLCTYLLITRIVSEILQSTLQLGYRTTNLFSTFYTDAFPTGWISCRLTARPFWKDPLTGSTKSQFVGTLHSSLRQKLQTSGCSWSCRVEGPKKLFLQRLSRDPQGPFRCCLTNGYTLTCTGERMLTAF